MEGHVLGQGDGQVEPQGQVIVPLGEAVDLLLGLPAALGQQDLRRLDDGGVQGGEAVEGVGLPEAGKHPLELGLGSGEQLHKTGQSPGFHTFHGQDLVSSFRPGGGVHIKCQGTL